MDIERNQEKNRLIGVAWDKAEMIDVMSEYYKCKSSDNRFLQSFEMDGYKFVVFNNGYGSAMVAVPLNNNEEYIRMLRRRESIIRIKISRI